MYNNFQSEVFYLDTFDTSSFDLDNDLLIIDSHVADRLEDKIQNWRYQYSVTAGEDLKEFTAAAKHIAHLSEMWGLKCTRRSRIVVCGGGSVGDFGGFFASIIKRGVELVHIPSTWLAAFDSAHGGKTGLNIQRVKNQIGTFYPANQIYLFKDLLFTQPQERAVDAFGECLKMLILDGPSTLKKAMEESSDDVQTFLWENLSLAVNKKYQIVQEDPYELTGKRKTLNFGHTFGHVLESLTGEGHGLCVLQGLLFSLDWSVEKKEFDSESCENIKTFIRRLKIPIWLESSSHVRMSVEQLQNLLLADKKRTSKNEIDFIFIHKNGEVSAQSTQVADVVQEARRQGWLNS